MDARCVNRLFKKPPGVSLCGAEVLSTLETSEHIPINIATIDIRDCFHRLKLDDHLSDHFAFEGGTAAEFGIEFITVEGVVTPIGPDTTLFPCCQCLPMGPS